MTAESVAPEREIAVDIARRAVTMGPIVLVICAAIWGTDGVASAALALALVIVNFLIASSLITWSARISPNLMMAAVLGGYVGRLALLTAVVLPLRDASWFSIAPFAIVLITSHLGLLVWEMRYISASLAYPGLAPGKSSSLAKGSSLR